MRIKLCGVIAAIALFIGSASVQAASVTIGPSALPTTGPLPPNICAGILGNPIYSVLVTACTKGLINRQSLINTSTSIRNVIVDRFDKGPNQEEPAGLELSDPNEILQRLSGNGEIIIAPTAGAPAAAPSKWNIWTDGKYSWLNDTSAVSNLDGSLINTVIGADYKVTDRLVLGLMGTYEDSRLKGSGLLPPTQKTNGWGGGAYMGLTLTDNLVFSANVLGTSLDTTTNGVVKFDSERWQTSEALTGYWYSGTWRFSPSLTFAWSKEWQDSVGPIHAQTIETAIVSPAMQIGDTISIGGANTVEPWLGAEIDWAVRNRVKDKVIGTIVDDPNTDLRLQTGLNFAFGANAQLALTAEMSGILLSKSDTYTAGANFAYQF